MITINPGTFLWVMFFSILSFCSLRTTFYSLVITSVLTSITFILIGADDSITVHHMVFLICAIKFFGYSLRGKLVFSVDKLLIIFVIWCLLSIPLSLFHPATIARNVEGRYIRITFSFHQFGQYAYLLIGFLVCFMCNSLLLRKVVTVGRIMKALEVAYVVTLSIALLQHVLPVSFVNSFLRNNPLAGFRARGDRISGTFMEPSMQALYCTPLFAMFLYRFLRTFKKKDLVLVLLLFFVTLDNSASTAVMGMIGTGVFIVACALLRMRKHRRQEKNRIVKLMAILFLLAMVVIICSPQIAYIYEDFAHKIAGEGYSGRVRTETLSYHLRLARSVMFFPLGYGSAESGDIITTWICNVGVIGFALYLIPIIKLSIKLYRKDTLLSMQLLIAIFVHNLILCTSCNDIAFLSIWIIYGIAYYYVGRNVEDTLQGTNAQLILRREEAL